MEKLKEKLGENWKSALIVALALGVGMLFGQAGLAMSVADGMVDKDLRAEICADYAPVNKE